MADLSKLDHDTSSAHNITLAEWLAFWEEMIALTGPYSPEQLVELQQIFESRPSQPSPRVPSNTIERSHLRIAATSH